MALRHIVFFFAFVGLVLVSCAKAAPAPAGVPAPAAAAFDATWLVGTWVSRDSETPLGKIPFGFEFVKEDDGSVHAHTGDDKRFVDLRFVAAADGWILDERAALPGVGDQAYRLHPRPASDGHEWHLVDKPGLLVVRLTRRGDDKMTLAVLLRGEPHVRFELERVAGGGKMAR